MTMISTQPKFRSDLTVSEQQTASGRSFIIKDPVSGQYFYFGETERFIAQQFDGNTPIPVARQRTEEKFGAPLPEETLNAFLNNLEKAGLLETQNGTKERRSERTRRLRGSLLYLRFKLLDPNRLLDRHISKVQFFFTPYFLMLSAALIVLATTILIANWNEFTRDLSRLYQLASIPLIMAVLFFVVSAHEFAHGFTCKHFGGEVREMGFMLIYFQPALYCNVSDAWLFPEKSKRLWVGFAGAYFELFLWALATITWRVTDTGTISNYLALIVMAGSGVKTLLNFNPFIKLDGYYLLSDYLEIPNLRRRSFRYVGDLIKKPFSEETPETRQIPPRERRIYFVYGLVATMGSFSLLTYLLTTFGSSVIQAGPFALMLASVLLSAKLRRRLRKLFGRATNDDDMDDDEIQNEPARASNHQSSRKGSRKWKRRLKLLIGAGALTAFLFIGRMELRVTGPFNILPIHNADVRTEIEGIIEEIKVTEGDVVQAGDLIARLSDREHRTELQKTEAQIRQTRARLQMQINGPTKEEVNLARTAIEKAQDRLRYAQARSERNKALFEKNLLSQMEYENTQELTTLAEADLAEAKNKLAVLLRGPRSEEIEATKAELEQLEAQQRYLEGQIQRVEVRSPVNGIVATPARQLKEMVGQAIQKGTLIAKVYDFEKLTVEIGIPEKEIADVRPGQQVAFKAKAYPDNTFFGVVTSIATTAQGGSTSPTGTLSVPGLSGSGSAERIILVTTEVDNSSKLLKSGMTGQAKIYCGERRLIDLAMRRLARMFKVEFWSWW